MPTGSEPTAPAELIDTPEAGAAVIRGGAIRTVAWTLGLLVSVASAPVLVRYLGPVDYGRYLTIISVVQMIALVADNALGNLALREYTSQPLHRRLPTLRNLLGLRLVMTVVGLVAGFAFVILADYDDAQVTGLAVAGASLFVFDYVGAFQAPLAVGLRLVWVSVIELVRNIVGTVALVALVVAGAGLLAFYAVPTLGAIAGFVVAAAVVRRDAPWMPSFDLGTWRPWLRDMLPIAAATTFGSLYFRVVLLVVSIVGTAQVLGDFSVSFRIMEIAVSVPMLLVATAFPVIVRAAQTDRKRLEFALGLIVETGLIAGTLMGLAIFLTAELGVLVVSGERAPAMIEALRVQAFTLPANFLIAGWGYALLSLREHGRLLVANAAAMVCAVALAAVLTPPWGASGAATAILVTEILLAAIYAVQLRGIGMHIEVSRRVVVAAAGFGVLALAVGVAIPAPEPVGAVIGVSLYLAGLVAVRAVPGELLAALPFVPERLTARAAAPRAQPDRGSAADAPADTPRR